MRLSIKKGMGFGITSGIITTLGLMVGLYSSTNSKFVVLGGILTIAIADAFSDALGIHISEESVYKGKYSKVWESTFATLFFKFRSFIRLCFIFFFFNLSLNPYPRREGPPSLLGEEPVPLRREGRGMRKFIF